MTPGADLLVLAGQGDAGAIATLLNRQLAPRGLRIQAKRKDTVLLLLITADPVPQQAPLLGYLQQSFRKLASPQITQIRVFAKAHDQTQPAWRATLELTPPAVPPPPPSPPVEKIPTRPFLSQWVLYSLVASGLAAIVELGGGAIFPAGFVNELVVNSTSALIFSGTQSYLLARRLTNAPWWMIASLVSVLIPFQGLRPVQAAAVLVTWGLQVWVLSHCSDRAYWWLIVNLLTVIGVGFLWAVVMLVNPVGLGFTLLLGLAGLMNLLNRLSLVLLVAFLSLIQGLVLKELLAHLPDRAVPPPEVYFRRAVQDIGQTLQVRWQQARQR